MAENEQTPEKAALRAVIEAVPSSPTKKKLVIAGPATGKTMLFKQLLELAPGKPEQRIVLTFINNLRDDLQDDLGEAQEALQVDVAFEVRLKLLYEKTAGWRRASYCFCEAEKPRIMRIVLRPKHSERFLTISRGRSSTGRMLGRRIFF